MATWHVKQNESELGPLKPSELLDLVRNGSVVAETMLRKDDSAWFPASDVGGLFEAARRPTIEHFCPDCGAPVSQPPTHCPRCIKDLSKTRTRIVEHNLAVDGNTQPASSKGPGESAKRWLHRRLGRSQ
ncbi:MAG: DUF4339 domain-containing protein [Planctomycetota bacterium]